MHRPVRARAPGADAQERRGDAPAGYHRVREQTRGQSRPAAREEPRLSSSMTTRTTRPKTTPRMRTKRRRTTTRPAVSTAATGAASQGRAATILQTARSRVATLTHTWDRCTSRVYLRGSVYLPMRPRREEGRLRARGPSHLLSAHQATSFGSGKVRGGAAARADRASSPKVPPKPKEKELTRTWTALHPDIVTGDTRCIFGDARVNGYGVKEADTSEPWAL